MPSMGGSHWGGSFLHARGRTASVGPFFPSPTIPHGTLAMQFRGACGSAYPLDTALAVPACPKGGGKLALACHPCRPQLHHNRQQVEGIKGRGLLDHLVHVHGICIIRVCIAKAHSRRTGLQNAGW
eukprot:scaffold28632_cov18-Tisochrysis_lutea.AAC.2